MRKYLIVLKNGKEIYVLYKGTPDQGRILETGKNFLRFGYSGEHWFDLDDVSYYTDVTEENVT